MQFQNSPAAKEKPLPAELTAEKRLSEEFSVPSSSSTTNPSVAANKGQGKVREHRQTANLISQDNEPWRWVDRIETSFDPLSFGSSSPEALQREPNGKQQLDIEREKRIQAEQELAQLKAKWAQKDAAQERTSTAAVPGRGQGHAASPEQKKQQVVAKTSAQGDDFFAVSPHAVEAQPDADKLAQLAR